MHAIQKNNKPMIEDIEKVGQGTLFPQEQLLSIDGRQWAMRSGQAEEVHQHPGKGSVIGGWEKAINVGARKFEIHPRTKANRERIMVHPRGSIRLQDR
jgi:hypothetical protein